MKMNTRIGIAAVTLAMGGLGSADIIWSLEASSTASGGATAPYTTLDTVLEQVNFGGGTPAGWTDTSSFTTIELALIDAAGDVSSNGGPWSTSTADLDAVVANHDWHNGGGPSSSHMITGLTPGHLYKIQFFMNDNRVFGADTTGTRISEWDDGSGNSIQTTRGDGNSVIGSFTALGTTQAINWNSPVNGNGVQDDLALNGFILSTSVPEPSGLALLGLAGLGWVFRLRHR